MALYSLLIVDDERIIADLLAEMFQHKKELNLDVHKAYSSREALAILEKCKIDIMLTDVTMPGMTGIELQKEAARLWPKCRFIFLTAYGEFEYIQSAMRNQAVDFVLKSEKDDVLLCSVQTAIEALDREAFTEDYISKMKSSFSAALPVLQQSLMEEIGNGEVTEQSQREKMFGEYEINLDPKREVLLLVGRVDGWETKKIRKYIYVINKMSMEVLAEECRVFVFLQEDQYVVWLMQPLAGGDKRKLIGLANNNVEKLQQICKDIGGISVSLILSSHLTLWNKVSESFTLLRKKLDRYFGLSNEMVIQETEEEEQEERGEGWEEAEFQQNNLWTDEYTLNSFFKRINFMRLFLESGQQEDFFLSFDQMTEEILEQPDMPLEIKTEVALQMNLMFYRVIYHKKIENEIAKYYSLERLTFVEKELDLLKRMGEYRETAQFIFNRHEVEKLSNMRKVFGKLRFYIHDHVDGDLSLHRLAKIVHFNPSYLSRLFKAVINKSLSEYISEVRIQKACDLLSGADMKVADVASAVGYENQQNFTRFFKRHMNVSPMEYRESSRKNVNH